MPENSDLTEMLNLLAAEVGLSSFTTGTEPQLAEVLIFINNGIKDLLGYLLPARLDTGEWTPGRVDKLLKLQAQESASGTSTAALPTTNRSICHYSRIIITPNEGTAVSADEVTLWGLLYNASGTLAIAASNPAYAWGNTLLNFRPSGASTSVTYNFLTLPADMAVTTAEVFPLSRDLLPVVLKYVRCCIWAQGGRDVQKAAEFQQQYFAAVNELIGVSQQLREKQN